MRLLDYPELPDMDLQTRGAQSARIGRAMTCGPWAGAMTIVRLMGGLGSQMLQCAPLTPNTCDDLATESAVVEARARRRAVPFRRLRRASGAETQPVGWIAR